MIMWKKSLSAALVAGVLFILMQWFGDVFIFDTTHPWYILLIEFVIFTVFMTPVYYFFHFKKKGDKK